MSTGLPVLAGAVSTAIFALGALPMLVKAARTKDLSSYSLGNILVSVLHVSVQPAMGLRPLQPLNRP